MPRGDGNGPTAGGKGSGGGSGSWETRPGSGPGGECICPVCGKVLPHRRTIPCKTVECPDCGATMNRKI